MIYYLAQALLQWSEGTVWADRVSALRLFRYITVRSAGAAVTALLLSWWLGPHVIAWLKRVRFGQHYEDKAEEAGGMDRRLQKQGTPTMGGIMIVAAMDLTALLWAQWNTLLQLTLLSVLVLAGLGFYDDYAKITQQSNKGAASHVKLWVQSVLAVFIGVYLWQLPSHVPLDQRCDGALCEISGGERRRGGGRHRVSPDGADHRGQLQRSQFDGRARRTGDRLHADRFVCVSDPDLCGLQRENRGLPAGALRGWRGRIDGVLRGHDRGWPGVSLVQLPPGAGVYGRHRVAAVGRRAWGSLRS